MAESNRVNPFGQIVAIDQRGLFIGNRGCIHRDRTIVRPWKEKRWIVCDLEHNGWVAPKWQPNRWTPLFFWDEAVAFAAGHRPCSMCRHSSFVRWMDAWQSATGTRPAVTALDQVMHNDRIDDNKQQLRYRAQWSEVPDGAFALIGDLPMLVIADRLVPWRPFAQGYGTPVARPTSGQATLITPRSTVAVLRHGYRPVIHPSALATG
jgi:hypothetical protein